jgi:ABC-type transporter Mla subunit MlaD
MDLTDPPHDPNHDPDRDPEHDAVDELVAYADQAEDAIRQLARLTLHAPTLMPADVDRILGHLGETVAALPQVATQLSQNLERTRDRYDLAMDGMTATTDPELAIDTARLHLDEARHPALATYRHLNAARTEVAHISATPINDVAVIHPSPVPRHSEDRQPPTRPQRHGPAR